MSNKFNRQRKRLAIQPPKSIIESELIRLEEEKKLRESDKFWFLEFPKRKTTP